MKYVTGLSLVCNVALSMVISEQAQNKMTRAERKCPNLDAPVNGKILDCGSLGWLLLNEHPSGSECSFQCNPGYELTNGRTVQSAFCHNGVWSSLEACQSTEVKGPSSCSPPTAVQGGSYVCTSTTHTIGSSCQLQCSANHKVSGNASITCTDQGLWTSPGACVGTEGVSSCNQPPTVENGTFVCTSTSHRTGSTCQLYCSRSHRVSGNDNISCSDQGQWTSPGACVDSQCPPPPQIQHGLYVCPSKSYPHGSTCYLQCESGYRPVSDSINIACRQNETWSPSTSCTAGCPAGSFINTTSSCALCPKGSYQPVADQTSCLKCPPTWTTAGGGSTDINSCSSMCRPGTVSSTGMEPCHLCPPGTYQDSRGGTTCLDCPPGLSTLHVGSADCVKHSVNAELQ